MAMLQKNSTIDRRTFIAGTVSTGLVMGLGAILPGCSREEVVSEIVSGGMSKLFSPAVWFEIDASGGIQINIAKAEMGQHVGTALARIVADELGADWNDVSIKHVDTDPKWGYMVTGGSWSVFTSFAMLSNAGAAGRTILIEAAAKLLGVDEGACIAADSRISAGDKSISYADIVVQGDISRTFSDEELAALPMLPAADRRLIGMQTASVDIPEKSTGTAVYGIDATLPNMLYAHPMMPPTRYGATISSIDDTPAKDIPGYLQTLRIDDPSDTLQAWAVVIAESYPAAMKAADAVNIEWQAGDRPSVRPTFLLRAPGLQLIVRVAYWWLTTEMPLQRGKAPPIHYRQHTEREPHCISRSNRPMRWSSLSMANATFMPATSGSR